MDLSFKRIQKAEVGKSKLTNSLLAPAIHSRIIETIFQYFDSIFLALALKFCKSRRSSALSARHQDHIRTDLQRAERKCKRGRESERERERERERKTEAETEREKGRRIQKLKERKRHTVALAVAVRVGDFGSKLLFSPCLYWCN